MATLPTESDLTGATRTNAQMRATHAQLRAYLAGMLGVDGTVPAALAALGVLASAGHVTRTSATTLTAADRGRVISATSGSWTLTLPGAAAAGAGWAVILRNTGTGTVTVARAGSDLIDGVSSVALLPGTAALVMSTGSAWVSSALGGVIGGPLRAPDGTAALPGLAFGADPDTGLSRPGANQIGLVTGGVQRGLLSTTALTLDVLLAGLAVIQNSLDTTTGRLLANVGNAGAFGLGGTFGPQLADLDATTVPAGLYFFNLSSGSVGTSPGFSAGAILVMQSIGAGANAPVQIALERTSSAGRMCWRNSQAGVWGAWRTVLGRGDILGTVAWSGENIGAIMEEGVNANGRYSRYADGRQICEHVVTATGGTTVADGALFRSAIVPWTYPAAFISAPAIYGDCQTAGRFVQCASRSATNVNGLRLYSTVSDGADISFTVRAEGRWRT